MTLVPVGAIDIDASFSGSVSIDGNLTGDASGTDNTSVNLSDSRSITEAKSNQDINLSDNGSVTVDANVSVTTTYRESKSGSGSDSSVTGIPGFDKAEITTTSGDIVYIRVNLNNGNDNLYLYEKSPDSELAAGETFTINNSIYPGPQANMSFYITGGIMITNSMKKKETHLVQSVSINDNTQNLQSTIGKSDT